MKVTWLLVLLLSALPVQAEVFKWFDEQGKIQYGDRPPPGVKAVPVSGGVMVVPAFVPQPAASQAAVPPPAASIEDKGPAGGAINLQASSSAGAGTASAQESLRQRLLEACQRNRGSNCEAEVDAQLSGQPGTVYVPVPVAVPGWSQPAIRPRAAAQASSKAPEARSHPESAAVPAKRQKKSLEDEKPAGTGHRR